MTFKAWAALMITAWALLIASWTVATGLTAFILAVAASLIFIPLAVERTIYLVKLAQR